MAGDLGLYTVLGLSQQATEKEAGDHMIDIHADRGSRVTLHRQAWCSHWVLTRRTGEARIPQLGNKRAPG